MLTSIPLHAAGIYPKGPRFSDYFISSYTPTLSALLKAQQSSQHTSSTDSGKILLGSVEHTNYGYTIDLPGTVEEIGAIKELLSGKQPLLQDPSKVVVLHGATSMALKEQLKDAAILHLASHGIQDDQEPLESGFLMADQKLTIRELMKLSLPKAFLAVLSACHTARGDDHQPDQTVHLAATMLFLGFKSVVATLWCVPYILLYVTSLLT